MKFNTRVDKDIKDYIYAALTKQQVDRDDVNKLLDIYKDKFNLDTVFVAETLCFNYGFQHTYVSYAEGTCDLLNMKHEFSKENWEQFCSTFDEDGMCIDSIAVSSSEFIRNVMYYGIMRNGECDGFITFIDYSGTKVWSDEEKAAIKLLGEALRPAIQSSRLDEMKIEESKDKKDLVYQIKNEDEIAKESRYHKLLEFISKDYCSILLVNFGVQKIWAYRAAGTIEDSNTGMEVPFATVGPFFKAYIEVIHPDDRILFKELMRVEDFQKKLARDGSITVNYRVIKENTTTYLQMKIVNIQDIEDLAVMITFQNISDIIKTEQRRQSEMNRQIEITKVLAGDYSSVYHVNLDTGDIDIIRISDKMMKLVSDKIKAAKDYKTVVETYIALAVTPETRDTFLHACSLETVKAELEKKDKFSIEYSVNRHGDIRYFEMRMAKLNISTTANEIVVGFRDITDILKKEKAMLAEIRSKNEELRLNEVRLARYQNVLVKAIMGNLESITLVSLENWRFVYLISDNNKLYEQEMSMQWDDYYSHMMSMLYPEDAAKYRHTANRAGLEQAQIGDVIQIHYRTLYSLRNSTLLNDRKCGYFTTKFYITEIDGERVAIVTTTDDTETEERQQKTIRFLKIAKTLSNDYDSVFYVNLDEGDVTAMRIQDRIAENFGHEIEGKFKYNVLVKEYIESAVHPNDKKELMHIVDIENIKKQLKDKLSFRYEYRSYSYLNAEPLTIEMKVVKVEKEGPVKHIVLGFIDITEKVRKEREYQNTLKDALVQAEHASKAKSDFLSNMSHDIRTPMNAIIGFTALATTHIDQSEMVKGYLKKIMVSSNHLLSLINDVLDMSRIESGKIHLEENACNLADIMHDLRSIIQSQISAKRQELFIDTVDVIDEDIFCDKLRLSQILINLLSNATKYTEPGGTVSVRIIQKPSLTDGYAHYEFRIKDTGIGMSKEFLEKLFEPFERERNSTTSGVMGTGLGLAIVKTIVSMMNGTIEVNSEVGKGSEFIINISFKIQTDKKPEPVEIESLKGLRALVVDDDFNTCDSVTKMLFQIGMRAEWTMYGKEAVIRSKQALEMNDKYYVYIVDLQIPDMNGIEVVRQIRRDIGEDVPIIILTAYDWSEIEEEARAAGVTSFVSKPIFMSDLRRTLLSAMNREDTSSNDIIIKREEYEGIRILLVEDNVLNSEIAVAILTQAGFVVECAVNGQEAVEMVEASAEKNSNGGTYYDIILMDVQMPVMNGYEATERIRKLENKSISNIPILAMTANAFEEDKKKSYACGMDGHLSKPINVTEIFDTIYTVLEKRRNKTNGK